MAFLKEQADRRTWSPFVAPALAVLAAVAVASTLVWRPPLLLVWNASKSVPIGLYGVEPKAAMAIGDLAVAFAPDTFRTLADRRRYVPASVPLVKRIAASSGTRVCARGAKLTIDGKTIAYRLKTDGGGRRLPWWSGCRRLRDGELFLIGDEARSFDSRYFGPIGARALLGKAIPLWSR